MCEAPLDTVGAVCVDQRGGVAGGVSSGGISLKFPGRIGQVSICWLFVTTSDGLLSPRPPCMAVAVGHTVSAIQPARQWPAVHQVYTTTVTILTIHSVIFQGLGNISLRPC